MNEHVRDSSGLPLRAMVMVLLFLGIVFLLVGFQAVGSTGDDGGGSDTPATVTTTAAPEKPEKPQAAAADATVRVYGSPDEEDAANRTADVLRGADWNVTAVESLTVPDVTATTVYFGDTPGEREAAEAVAELLRASVQPRTPDLAEQPPGVIVVVATET